MGVVEGLVVVTLSSERSRWPFATKGVVSSVLRPAGFVYDMAESMSTDQTQHSGQRSNGSVHMVKL